MNKSKISLEFLSLVSNLYQCHDLSGIKITKGSGFDYRQIVDSFYTFISKIVKCPIQRDEEFRILLPEVVGIGNNYISSPESFLLNGACSYPENMLELQGICSLSSLGYEKIYINNFILGKFDNKDTVNKVKIKTLSSHLMEKQISQVENELINKKGFAINRKNIFARSMEQIEKYSCSYTSELGRGLEALPQYSVWYFDNELIVSDATTLSKIGIDSFIEDIDEYLAPIEELSEMEVKSIDGINNYFNGFKRYV